MKAILQGEFHISDADRENLESRIGPNTDAVFIEGRGDSVSPSEFTIGYLMYMTGLFTIFWFQHRLGTEMDFEAKYDLPVYDEIDSSFSEIYSRTPVGWRTVFLFISLFLMGAGILRAEFTLPIVELPFFGLVLYSSMVKLLMALGAPLLFSFCIIFFEERSGGRDCDMANAIDSIANREGHDVVVVSCGQAHLEEITRLLEERGWDVDPYDSKYKWLAKIWA